MKHTILTLLFFAAALAAAADDYQYLTVASSGVEQSVELQTVRKITFENHNVVVYTADGTLTFAQSEMEKMFFSATPTALDALPSETEGLRVADGQLHVEGLAGNLYIYASTGALVRMARVSGAATVSLANLPKGVYIVRLGQQTLKLRR